MRFLPKTGFVLVAALFALSAHAQELTGTLKKIKDSGTITLGARESSGALAYTLGDGKYVGFHTEMSEKIAADIQKQPQDAEARRQVPTGDLAEPHSAGAERHGGPGVRLDHQQRGAAEGRGVRDDDLCRGRPHRRQGQLEHQRASPDLNGKTVATTTGTTSVQTLRKNKRAANMDFKEVFGKDHADSFLLLESGRADAFVMDGQILARPRVEVQESGRLQDPRRSR